MSSHEASRVGLMSSFPLYWAESGEFGDLLRQDEALGWVRAALETRYRLEPIDTLDESALKGLDRLILAQPRALSPAENVALDDWVRRGGRLLLFADPMVTRHSRFAIGDRRRPQDVVLLSPILTHWGLALTFDPDQPEARRTVDLAGVAIPVALPGRLAAADGSGCSVAAQGIAALCRVGQGRVLAIADSAMLDDPDEQAQDIAPRRESFLTIAGTALD